MRLRHILKIGALLFPSTAIADCTPAWKVNVAKVFDLKKSNSIELLVEGGQSGSLGLLPKEDAVTIIISQDPTAISSYAIRCEETGEIRVVIRSDDDITKVE